MSIYISYMGGEGEFSQQLTLLDDSGKAIIEPPGQELSFPQISEVVTQVPALELPAPGRYWFSLSLDGEEVKRIFITTREVVLRDPFTDQELRELLANPKTVKSVRAQAECKKCRRKHHFQMNLDPSKPIGEGAKPFPESKSFVCECGVTHDLREAWGSAWQMLGSLGQEPKKPESQ